MINTWDEINKRFDAIKIHKPKASTKLNELAEILSSAYMLDAEKASDMWQYIVDLNIKDDVRNSKFYIAQVYKKLTGILTPEDAAILITMEPDRIQLMFLYGYNSGESLYQCLCSLIQGYIKLDNLDNAIVAFKYFSEKFGGINSEEDGFKRGVSELCEDLRKFAKNNSDYKEKVYDFFERLMDFENELVVDYANSMIILSENLSHVECDELFKLLDSCVEGKFDNLFLELIWTFKDTLDLTDVISFWEKYCSNMEGGEIAPKLNDFFSEDDWYNHDTILWFTELMLKSDILLEKYFDGSYSYSFMGEAIRIWIVNGDWDTFATYFSRALSGVENANYFSFYWSFLRNYMEYYRTDDNNTTRDYRKDYGKFTLVYHFSNQSVVSDNYGRSYNILNKKNINEFVEALAKISAMTEGTVCHDLFNGAVMTFLRENQGSIKNTSRLEQYGFSEKEILKTPVDEFWDYVRNTPRKIDQDARKFNELYYSAKKEWSGEIHSFDYEIALTDDVSDIICKKWQRLANLKCDLILECLTHNNNNRAIKLCDFMIETENYPDYSDCRNSEGKWVGYSWEIEIKNTVVGMINKAKAALPISQGGSIACFNNIRFTSEMIDSVIYLSKYIIPHLSKDSAREVQNALANISKNEEEKNEFVTNLLDDVRLYTTFPKPRGSWNTQQHNRITFEMINGFKTLSEQGKVEIISEILRMLYSVRDKLKPISLSMWMAHISSQVSAETCVLLLKENQQIFRGWLENAESRDIVSWAKTMGNGCSKQDFLQFVEMVTDAHGNMPDLMDYYREKI